MSFENHLINVIAPTLVTTNASTMVSEVVGEMGVINLRKDLFPWYEKMGYVVIGEIRPNDAEVSRIILEELDVCCILMRKVLKTATST